MTLHLCSRRFLFLFLFHPFFTSASVLLFGSWTNRLASDPGHRSIFIHTYIFTSAELCFGCGLYLERYRIFCISSICLLLFTSVFFSCLCTLVFLTFDRCTVRCQGLVWSGLDWSDSTALGWLVLLGFTLFYFYLFFELVFSY